MTLNEWQNFMDVPKHASLHWHVYIQWLSSQNALLPWMENLANEEKATTSLSSAFSWHETQQGRTYWSCLSTEWEKIEPKVIQAIGDLLYDTN